MENIVSIPENVKKIMQSLVDAGYETYIVGGCVRDQILKRKVKDYDITTSATPSEIKAVFHGRKVMDFGEKHGTVTILLYGQQYEITTFRTEGKYSDGRRPDTVEFVRNLEDDLGRRDFTINAIAAGVDGTIMDPFNGILDLQMGIIRAVRKPQERFEEDSLRILRAIRFSLRYGFTIDTDTSNAILETKSLILQHKISSERIATEMKEIILSGSDAISLLKKYELLEIIFPVVQQKHYLPALTLMREIKNPCLAVNYAVFFHETLKDRKIQHNQLFTNIKGYGKYTEEYIAILSRKFLPSEIIEHSNEMDLIFWLEKTIGKMSKKKEFDIVEFAQDIVQVSSIFHNSRIKNDLTQRIMDSYALLQEKLPVSGDDAKKLGFKGIKISSIISIWRSLYFNDKTLKKEDFIEYTESILNNPILYFSDVINEKERRKIKYLLPNRINETLQKFQDVFADPFFYIIFDDLSEINEMHIKVNYAIYDGLTCVTGNRKCSLNELHDECRNTKKKFIIFTNQEKNEITTVSNLFKS